MVRVEKWTPRSIKIISKVITKVIWVPKSQKTRNLLNGTQIRISRFDSRKSSYELMRKRFLLSIL